MPKVKPLGTPDMQAAAEARHAAEKLFKDKETLRRRIVALQKRAGYDSQDKFAAALGIEGRRLRYILECPERINLDEGAKIQALAQQYDGATVFDSIRISL